MNQLSIPFKVRAAIRSEGLRPFLSRMARRAWHNKEYTVFRKSLVQRSLAADHGYFTFRTADVDDTAWLSHDMTNMGAEAHSLLQQQFQNPGDVTTVGIAKGERRVLFCAWVSLDHLGLTLVSPMQPGGEASLRRVWVPEDYRRRGIAKVGVRFTEQEALAAGIRHMWSFVLVDNLPSQRLHKDLGYEDCGRFRIATRLGRRFAAWKLHGTQGWKKVVIPFEVSGL